MDGTIIQQGSFVSTGADVTLQLRSGVDWIRTYNLDASAGATQFAVTEAYWQLGMPANDGFINFHAAASQVISMSTSITGVGAGAVNGFTLVDSSIQSPGPAVAFTSLSTNTPPRVATGSTAGLATGSIVRLNTIAGAPQFGGIDFQITLVTPDTRFDLTYAPTLTVAGTTGFWRKIVYPPIFYPRRRFIMAITTANPAVVRTSVDHGYIVGQQVRMNIPAVFGMTQMDGLQGTIIATTASTFTLDIDSSAFTPFVFPLAGDVPFTPAEVIPFGEDTAQALASGADILTDATINTAFIGIVLAGGISSPAGQDGDTIFWVAGKSFNV